MRMIYFRLVDAFRTRSLSTGFKFQMGDRTDRVTGGDQMYIVHLKPAVDHRYRVSEYSREDIHIITI